MLPRMVLLLLSVSVAITSIQTQAAEESLLRLKPEIQRGDVYQPQGFWPLLGVGLGLTGDNQTIRTGGLANHVKLIGSYYFDTVPWVADLGLGLHNQFLSQEGSGPDTVQSLYTELAARYQFTDRWQLGAIWNTLVDNPDRYASNTSNLASFIGVQVMKEFVWDGQYLVRAGARGVTDVGISGETVDTVMAELQVSFGSGRPAPKLAPMPAPEGAPHLARQAVKSFSLGSGPVLFETNSTSVTKSSRPYLRRLAKALADNSHLFERVEVLGHADARGTEVYNERLSQRRAETITKSLLAAGLSPRQVRASGTGESIPLSQSMSDSALQQNRRVELMFFGADNPVALQRLISSISP